MKKWLKKWWFRTVIAPYMLKNPAICTVALRNAFVWQCNKGGMKFPQVNKWLRATNQDTIKAYTMTPNGPRVFYTVPDAEQRKTITGALITVAQD